ncbi:adenosylmethionine-8-amino-7-oxononanoate aminotransferase [Paenarthrobacter nitroguajacolicus]|uniref:daptide-type RiPP biosynthesis aminotransferase n=1 Tax=Paenarthrobacter TaxID=1742992 RepID=UPI00285A4348|nr:daptide-type RiPP biosynthesis aminotransferase [Paenarthrobacter nitroguajacolicus]MDR6989624.1 adenosylmethionine-8-amino-7-oxononanoate aminotransferase [Paenarthrobacter nitroguajacolicus]
MTVVPILPTPRTQLPLWVPLVSQHDFIGKSHTAVSAQGVHVTFEDGRQRICAKSGLWNANLGFGNQHIAEAIARELRTASYLPLFRTAHRAAIEASGALLALTAHSFQRVIFSTSGGSANDAVMKLARQYFVLDGQPERKLVVGLKGSYHGLTYGSHALSGDDLGQAVYGVDRRNVRHVSFDDDGAELHQLLQREGHRIAAVIIEPVLGSGAEAVPDAFIEAVIKHRDQHGFLMVADEVATGFGRVNGWFASDAWPQQPDVIVTSKGLTNGTSACAALLIALRVTEAFDANESVFVHGETQAGTPATCAAILSTIAEMKRLDHNTLTKQVAAGLDGLIEELQDTRGVGNPTGRGCMRSIKLRSHNGLPLSSGGVLAVVRRIHQAGAIVQPGPGRIQLLPALTYTPENFEELHAAVRTGLAAAERDGVFA